MQNSWRTQGYGVVLAIEKSCVRLPFVALPHNNLGQVVHSIIVPLSASSINLYWCKNREGNGSL